MRLTEARYADERYVVSFRRRSSTVVACADAEEDEHVQPLKGGRHHDEEVAGKRLIVVRVAGVRIQTRYCAHEVENNSRTVTPEHDVKPAKTHYQKAGPAIKKENLAKSAKPSSPVQIRRRLQNHFSGSIHIQGYTAPDLTLLLRQTGGKLVYRYSDL